MSGYNFDRYPGICPHLRHLAAFDGLAGPNAKGEFFDALAVILERLEKAEAFVEYHEMIQALTNE